jgi:hemerythrin-like domain-containing protein
MLKATVNVASTTDGRHGGLRALRAKKMNGFLRGGSVHEAIDVLVREHRRIEEALGSLETFSLAIEDGLLPDRAVVADYTAFFRGFADASHHGKEEDVLFARMIERGFSRDSGPIAVMLHDHVVGRGHVGALRQVGEGDGPVSGVEAHLVVEHASAFVPHLRAHIQKEDRILYPMALRLLTGSELDAILAEFEAFDAGRRAEGTHDRLEGLADRLIASFRPDPARMAAAEDLMGCGR